MLEENKNIVSSHLDLAWNQGDFDALEPHIASGFFYKTSFSEDFMDKNGYFGFISQMRTAVPDLRVELEEVLAEGNRVMSYVSFIGTVEHDLFDIKPSDRIITFPAISLWEMRKGSITNLNTMLDMFSLQRQTKAKIIEAT